MPEPLRITMKEATIAPISQVEYEYYPSLFIAILDWRGWLVAYGAINYSFRDLFLHEDGRNVWKF
jgi:hypothetical protein